MKHILCALFLCSFSFSFSQQVETVTSHPKIVDGLHVDPAGNVYTTSGGLVGGFEIGKYDLSTDSYDAYYASGFFGPIDIDQYQDSFLVVSNFDNNTVSRYNMNSGVVDVLASSLDGPAGIAIDGDDNIFVTNFGVPTTYAGHEISKITPAGVVSVYIDSTALFRLQGICFDHEDVMIVHSQESLYKVNAADSSLVHWIDLGYEVGNMTFRYQDSCIYTVAGGNADRIIRITAAGVVSVFSGSVSGYADGDISLALFANPLGVAFSPGEDTLYISEVGTRLRRILFDQITGLFIPQGTSTLLYPNPVSDVARVQSERDEFAVRISNSLGSTVFSREYYSGTATIDIQHLSPGTYYVEIVSDGEKVHEKLLKL